MRNNGLNLSGQDLTRHALDGNGEHEPMCRPEPTYDNENVDMNGPIDRKPDLAQLDAEMPEEDENMRESANPQAHAADTEMQNVSQDEHFMQ